jgi:hypothetical protein
MSIYKITNSENDFVYVGKTVKSLAQRLYEHELDYGGWLSRGCRRDYISSFEILKFNSYKIELIETVDDENMLKDREKYYINHIDCVNMRSNTNVSKSTFSCPCGKEVNTSNRFKHTKSPDHRRAIREIHSKTNSRVEFIKKYKNSKICITSEIVGGITLNINY